MKTLKAIYIETKETAATKTRLVAAGKTKEEKTFIKNLFKALSKSNNRELELTALVVQELYNIRYKAQRKEQK